MNLSDLVDTSARVAGTRARSEKIGLLADCLGRLSPPEREAGAAFLTGQLRQGRIGLGGAAIRQAMPPGPASSPGLTVAGVDTAFEEISRVSGPGSAGARVQALAGLLEKATKPEQDWLARLVFGELRQGAQEGVLIEAVARASGVPAPAVRRAVMLAGDLVRVAVAALDGGEPALAEFRLRLMSPVLPMLAQSAEGVEDVLERHGRVALDYKLDGARIQVHRQDDEVRLFTRRLNDVTAAAPELVEAVRALPARQLVLDGEAIVLRGDGRPAPFQQTMRRFGRRLDVERMRADLPLSAFYFDCLHLDGQDLIDADTSDRLRALHGVVPQSAQVPHTVADAVEPAREFIDRALSAGHEGVVAKDLAAPYEAGRRGAGWLKLKPAHTLDLVVLAVEWGSGRRRGWLSNLHLGARDPAGGFVMLGKTFKGMTDEMLAWQTETLLGLETGREGHVVHVRPELVVEIAFDGLQASPHYPGGLALRFARVKRYRPDKAAGQADDIETVRRIFASQTG